MFRKKLLAVYSRILHSNKVSIHPLENETLKLTVSFIWFHKANRKLKSRFISPQTNNVCWQLFLHISFFLIYLIRKTVHVPWEMSLAKLEKYSFLGLQIPSIFSSTFQQRQACTGQMLFQISEDKRSRWSLQTIALHLHLKIQKLV